MVVISAVMEIPSQNLLGLSGFPGLVDRSLPYIPWRPSSSKGAAPELITARAYHQGIYDTTGYLGVGNGRAGARRSFLGRGLHQSIRTLYTTLRVYVCIVDGAYCRTWKFGSSLMTFDSKVRSNVQYRTRTRIRTHTQRSITN